jgi:hypothetical protein
MGAGSRTGQPPIPPGEESVEINLEKYVSTILSPSLAKGDKPQVMLITCMDYRYAHRIVDVMDRWGLRLQYDFFVLAGAALGANPGAGMVPNTVPQAWRDALVGHVRAALALGHPIGRVVILEHRHCGAYKHFLGLDWEKVLPGDEAAEHLRQVRHLIAFLKAEFARDIPRLAVDALLLARDEDDELHIETTPP